MSHLGILVSDLDGTLTNEKHSLSARSLATLQKLREKRVLSVIATGRNLFSSRQVLTPSLPFDFLIFSGGVGILDWKTSELLFSSQLSEEDTKRVTDYLVSERRNFMIQAPLPENHLFEYWKAGNGNSDFQRRCELYAPYCRPWERKHIPSASQIIVVEPQPTGAEVFHTMARQFPELSVVRTTSPLDSRSVWVEVSASGISKASAANWLCRKFQVPSERSIGVGNDYNDRDLLDWVRYPFVVDNAPTELKEKYRSVSSHHLDGFSEAVEAGLTLLGIP